MSHDINTYLDELRRALAGADPAVIHDALYDAEEHLRSEFAAAQAAQTAQAASGEPSFDADAALARIMESYGTPEEVAAAYLEAEGQPASAVPVPSGTPSAGANPAATGVAAPAVARTVTAGAVTEATGGPAIGTTVAAATPAAASSPTSGPGVASSVSWASFFGVMTDRRTWLSLLYMLIAFGTGIAYFTWVVTGVSLAAGLAVLIVGVPFALFFLASVRGIAFVEGRLVEALLGRRMPRRPSFGPTDPSIVQRILFWLRDRRTWTTMLYLLLQLPLGIAYFVVVVTGFTTSVALIVSPVVYAVGRSQQWVVSSSTVDHWTVNGLPLPAWSLALAVLAGVALLFGTLHLVRLVGRLHGAYAKVMLVGFGQEAASAAAQPPSATAPDIGPTGGAGGDSPGGGGAATLSAPLPFAGAAVATVDCIPSGESGGGLRWLPVGGDPVSMWRYRQ